MIQTFFRWNFFPYPILGVDFQILLSADIKNLIDQTLHFLATLGMHQARSLLQYGTVSKLFNW